jgi:hypothetical protein
VEEGAIAGAVPDHFSNSGKNIRLRVKQVWSTIRFNFDDRFFSLSSSLVFRMAWIPLYHTRPSHANVIVRITRRTSPPRTVLNPAHPMWMISSVDNTFKTNCKAQQLDDSKPATVELKTSLASSIVPLGAGEYAVV